MCGDRRGRDKLRNTQEAFDNSVNGVAGKPKSGAPAGVRCEVLTRYRANCLWKIQKGAN